ncbi:hypothetical protein Tcan_04993 [Toxocara canis]|uniref:UBA domain-containing protein n=1 Tax=Toxocara canis TaxID=6265 RepID=A0A0B2VC75_TOXCA|nr:hypothetical protein Tcan_04993 [Toxocara canis]
MINVVSVERGVKFEKQLFEMHFTSAEVLEKLIPDTNERTSSCLVFLGKLIPADMKLSEVDGLKTGHTVYVMKRPQAAGPSKGPIDMDMLRKCRKAFSKMRNSRLYRLKLLEAIAKEDLLEHLYEKIPLLKHDVQACAVIRDYVLICWLLTDEEEAFVKAHPVVVDALYQILAELSPTASMSNFTEDAASAEHVSGAEGAQANVRPAPIITSQMLQEAMEQVFRTMGTVVSPVETPAAATSAVDGRNAVRFAAENAELVDFGFTDTEQNARVLEETGGDVQQALELLIALRESISGAE